jgi:hypothetical protein
MGKNGNIKGKKWGKHKKNGPRNGGKNNPIIIF